jgi:hypothetical protein
MQLLWLDTRKKPEFEERVLDELQQLRDGASTLKVRLADIQLAYIRAKDQLPHLHVPSRFRLFVKKWSPFTVSSGFYSSAEIIDFWRDTLTNLQKGRFFKVPVRVLAGRVWLDLCLSVHFATAWIRETATN